MKPSRLSKWLIVLIVALFLAVLSACNLLKDNLQVTITYPVTAQKLPINQEVTVNTLIEARRGWSYIELWVNSDLLRLDRYDETSAHPDIIAQPWIPTTPGPALIKVIVYSADGRSSAQSEVAVWIVEPAEALPTQLPSPTATSTATSTLIPTQANCTMAATFLGDVTIPEGTVIPAGAQFTKTWRVRNSGSCNWEGYQLVFVRGSLLGGRSPSPLPFVAGGSELDISQVLIAPSVPGDFEGVWMIQAANGSLIGPELRYRVRVPSPTATPSPTFTHTSTATRTLTRTATATPTRTPTPSATATATATFTASPSLTIAPSQTATATLSPTPSPTASVTTSATPTPTASATNTLTPSETPTATASSGTPAYSIRLVATANALPAGKSMTLSVDCPPESGVISGGYTVPSAVGISASYPTQTGWEIKAQNLSNASQLVSVHASCIEPESLTKGWTLFTTEFERDKRGHFMAACPKGGYALIGGYILPVGSDFRLLINQPENGGWVLVHNSQTKTNPHIQAILLCADLDSEKFSLVSQSMKVKPNQTEALELACPQGSQAFGGGYTLANGINILADRPSSDGWRIAAYNRLKFDLRLQGSLVCLSDPDQLLNTKTKSSSDRLGTW